MHIFSLHVACRSSQTRYTAETKRVRVAACESPYLEGDFKGPMSLPASMIGSASMMKLALKTSNNGESLLTCITTAGAELEGIHAAQSLHVEFGDIAHLLLGRRWPVGDAAAWASRSIARQSTNAQARQSRTPSCQRPGFISPSFLLCTLCMMESNFLTKANSEHLSHNEGAQIGRCKARRASLSVLEKITAAPIGN